MSDEPTCPIRGEARQGDKRGARIQRDGAPEEDYLFGAGAEPVPAGGLQ